HFAVALVEVDDHAAAAVEERAAREGRDLLHDLPLHLPEPTPAALAHDLGDGLRAALVPDESVEREVLEAPLGAEYSPRERALPGAAATDEDEVLEERRLFGLRHVPTPVMCSSPRPRKPRGRAG